MRSQRVRHNWVTEHAHTGTGGFWEHASRGPWLESCTTGLWASRADTASSASHPSCVQGPGSSEQPPDTQCSSLLNEVYISLKRKTGLPPWILGQKSGQTPGYSWVSSEPRWQLHGSGWWLGGNESPWIPGKVTPVRDSDLIHTFAPSQTSGKRTEEGFQRRIISGERERVGAETAQLKPW